MDSPCASTDYCVICFETKDREFASIKSCGHRFCTDCILQWSRTCRNPFCPLCFAPFDCIICPGGTEREIQAGSVERTEEPDFTGLDHSFFLDDIRRLLHRTQYHLKDLGLDRNRRRQLEEISRTLEIHKRHLEAMGEFNAESLLQELHSLDHVLNGYGVTIQTVENPSVPRIYGADDADLVSSDDESESWDHRFCDESPSYRRNRNGSSNVNARPSKPFENKPARMKGQRTQRRGQKKNALLSG